MSALQVYYGYMRLDQDDGHPCVVIDEDGQDRTLLYDTAEEARAERASDPDLYADLGPVVLVKITYEVLT